MSDRYLNARQLLKALGAGRLTMRRGKWIVHHKIPGLRQPGLIRDSMIRGFVIQGYVEITTKEKNWARITNAGRMALQDALIDEAAEKFAGVDR